MTAPILRRAAQAFRDGELRWGTGYFAQDGDGRCRCAAGAIAFAVDAEDDDANPMYRPAGEQAMEVLADYLIVELGATECGMGTWRDLIETVGTWNDEQASADAVIYALEEAAARAEVTA